MTAFQCIGRSGPWHLRVDLRPVGSDSLTALRVLLIADLFRRTARFVIDEPMSICIVGHAAGLPRTTTDAMGIELPTADPPTRESMVDPQRAPTVWLGPATGATPSSSRWRLRVAAVRQAGSKASVTDLQQDHEPRALRLALLRLPYASTAVLSGARLHRADETLHRWQYKMADWHDLPPGPAAGLDSIRESLSNGLDSAHALTLLHRLEVDPHLPSGSKYATFCQSDDILGLDLRRFVQLSHR